MFQGHGVYLADNKNYLPPGAVADRLAAGNFGPAPNQSAPPGYNIAPTMAPAMLAEYLARTKPPNPPFAPASSSPAPQMTATPLPMNQGYGVGGLSDASRGWSPGGEGVGWNGAGMGMSDGSIGWGGILGIGNDLGIVGYDAGSLGGPGAAGAIGSGGGLGGWGFW